jgi:uncharacterized membrane protein YcaP (DUF421 family)
LNQAGALADGVLASAPLIGLQFAITWSSVRAPWARRLVTGEPTLLLYRGEILRHALRRSRVTEAELRAALRNAGVGAVADATAVVLETEGSLSLVESATESASSTLPPLESSRST